MHVSQNVRIIPLVGDRKADKRAVQRKLKQRKRQRELNEERKLKVRHRAY